MTTEKPPGLGEDAINLYTDGHHEEALAFVSRHRYVWMDTASRSAHTELLALAATITPSCEGYPSGAFESGSDQLEPG